MISIKGLLIIGHLVGLVLGLGAATVADLLMVKSLLKNRISADEFSTFKMLTHIVVFGLMILGVTGYGFVAYYYFNSPELLDNPKMWAKIGIVTVLSVNGYFMHEFIQPLLQRNIGRPLFSIPSIQRARFFLFACGAISMTSWYSALIIGVWKEANFQFSYFQIFGGYALICILAILSTPVIGKIIMGIANRIAPRELQELQNGQALWGNFQTRDDVGPAFALLNKEIKRAQRANQELSCMLLRLEEMKSLRESLGGEGLDHLEKQVASFIFNCMRSPDHVCILGRGKYFVILPETNTSGAVKAVNRIGEQLSHFKPIETPQTRLRLVSQSVSVRPGVHTKPELLVRHLEEQFPMVMLSAG